MAADVVVVGGGLAGTEAAVQLARAGFSVALYEMKPGKRTPAQTGDGLAELVCSNSLRGAALSNAVGLLKEELRRTGSVVMEAALATAVPAGGALAVDRERFSARVTARIHAEPGIQCVHEEVTELPEARPLVLATGPLTSAPLAAALERAVGGAHLAYYDAIAPIVDAESIDWERVWKQSRYDKGSDDYVNCPLDQTSYEAFVAALCAAEKVAPRAFEEARYFEGCLPAEVMAERGPLTLAYGPLKPVGLTDPRTGRRPFAVLQLRQEDAAGTAYNLVGMQTRMKYAEQERVFRMIPGLERAELVRHGSVHRNTFVDAPAVLDGCFGLRPEACAAGEAVRGIHLTGQLAGVEGYVESAAAGLLCGRLLAERLHGGPPRPPPPTTALGGILGHIARPQPGGYQPSNVTWAHIARPDFASEAEARAHRRLNKRERYERCAERALADLDRWLGETAPRPTGP
ncbi:MAG: methylenetetrahydrofolate--tRNA-(uracil(54)-C(5))-methyltransferase (FADH(2)-oxidizing) TrmFO [Polyangiaceae bacterium]|nr:methylenetetrahydrofolate--tRNA-(uracil(54)-C(5))-methyltransferase (FADH(2)-oxidizing) TrmFO [Polyangiaceae bacterium]